MFFQRRHWLNPIQKCTHVQNGLHVLRQKHAKSVCNIVHKKHVKIFARACFLRTVYGPNVYRVGFRAKKEEGTFVALLSTVRDL
jgi:hypothetical protein